MPRQKTKPGKPEVEAAFLWPQTTSRNLALLAALTALFFLPVFIHPTQMFYSNDIIRAHAELKEVQWNSFWHWHAFPLWDPTVYCGKSIVGDPLPALLYPPSWIFWLIPAPQLFGFLLFFQVVLGAWGMFLFSRRKGCDASGAFIAAMGFALAGKTGAHAFAGHPDLLGTMLGLPWMLWALEGILQKPRFPQAVLLSGISALCAFGGNVQMLYWHMLFLGAYLAFWIINAWLELPQKPILPVLKSVLLAGVVFLVVAAPWWFPVIRQTLLLGARAQGTDIAFSFQGSPSFHDLLRFIWPGINVPPLQIPGSDASYQFFWETSSYPGIIILCLAIAAIFARLEVRGIVSLSLLGVITVVLALGENSPFYWLAWKIIPGFSLFRCPGRMFFYTNLIVSLLAGLMLTHARDAKPRWILMLVPGILFEATLFGPYLIARVSSEPIRGIWIPVICTFLITIISLFWFWEMLSDNLWRIFLISFLAVDLLYTWHPLINTIPPELALPNSSIAEFLAKQHEQEDFRIYDPTQTIEQQIAARDNLELITGYHPGISARHLDLYKKIWKLDYSDFTEQYMQSPNGITCPNIMSLMNVRYIVAFEPDLAGNFEKVFQTSQEEFRDTRYVYRVKDALPRAWMVAQAITPPKGTALLDELCNIDPKQVCLVEDSPIEGSAAYQEIRAERRSPSYFTLRFHTDAPGIVVVSETWHPDWRVIDNKQPVTIRRVNHNFLGIQVGQGDHVIKIWYRPWDFYSGLAFALPGWIFVAWACTVLFRRNKASIKLT